MLKFPMRPLSAGDLTPAGGFQVLDEFSDFARHLLGNRSRFPIFRAEFQNREVPSVGCLNNTANIPIKKAIQIYPSNASDAATNRASIEGRTSP